MLGKVHTLRSWNYKENGSILCRYRGCSLCYLGSIKKVGAYCVGRVRTMLPCKY